MAEQSQTHDRARDRQTPSRQPPDKAAQGLEALEQTAVEPAAAFKLVTSGPWSLITPQTILALQRSVGNRAVQRLLASKRERSSPVGNAVQAISQTRLTASPPGVQYEEDAVRMASSGIRHTGVLESSAVEREDEGDELYTKSAHVTSSDVRGALPEVDLARGHNESALQCADPVLQRKSGGSRAGQVSVHTKGTKYYHVTGTTLAKVAKQLDPTEWGACKWHYKYKYGEKDGTANRIDVTLTIRYRMPRWKRQTMKKASAAARKEWKRMIKCLWVHEKGHKSICKSEARRLQSLLLNKPVDDLPDMFDKFLEEVQAKNDAYDTKTGNGKTQGVGLDLSIK